MAKSDCKIVFEACEEKGGIRVEMKGEGLFLHAGIADLIRIIAKAEDRTFQDVIKEVSAMNAYTEGGDGKISQMAKKVSEYMVCGKNLNELMKRMEEEINQHGN